MNDTANQHPDDENDLIPDISLENVEELSGYTNLTGPAAFKAQQKAANEASLPDDERQALTTKIEEMEKSLAQGHEQMLRLVAEMDNLRKRFVREREDAAKYSISGFARDLLDVSDTFRRALQSIPEETRADEKIRPLVEGIEATERVLLNVFEKNGIKKLEPLDEPFNPNFHEVMFEAPVPDKAAGQIIQLVEAGYMLHDRLLRPARVGVAKGGASAPHAVDTNA